MNKNEQKQRVIIAGGGTSGWMAAAAIGKLIGKYLDVTLIESDEIGTVGVGEATIPTLHIFHQLLGIKENEIMAATNATFKLGISFENWRNVDKNYIHSFGFLGKDCWAAQFHHFWLKGLQKGIDFPIGDYCTEHLAAREQRFGVHLNQDRNHAYHLDATLYAKYLRKFAERFGVKRQEGKIVDVKLHADTQHIESITLASGQMISGDLFIDCTGFGGLLIEKTLHTGYEDWSHWLPCDRAIAVQTESTGEFLPYTRSIAREFGWQWRIPLQNRTGNGFVFCSRYMTDDEAIATLTQNVEGKCLNAPRVIPFRTGTRRKHWNKNCVAIGLSAGFIEPLESTSIHLIQRSIVRLLQLFPTQGIQQADVDEFNEQTRLEMENIRDFIVLHYHVTERDDSKFWRYCKNMSIPESLQHRLDLFKENARVYKYGADLFGESSWVQVMLGQGLLPKRYHPIVDLMGDDELQRFLAGIRHEVADNVKAFPDHAQFVKRYCPTQMTDTMSAENASPEKASSNETLMAPSIDSAAPDFSVVGPVSFSVKTIGNSQTPVMIIDHFAPHLNQSLMRVADTLSFGVDDDALYPGLRAQLPQDYVRSVVQAVGAQLYDIYGVPTDKNLVVTKACFSLITQPESSLDALQCIPHFDKSNPYSFAVLHYLADEPHGDTGFFRHLPTALERINNDNKSVYFAAANQFFSDDPSRPKTYMTASNEHYHLYDRVAYRKNRLVIYPGNLLHSVLVDAEKDISIDPHRGRLTANIFIEFQ